MAGDALVTELGRIDAATQDKPSGESRRENVRERMDRAMAKLDDVLNGPEPEPQPPPDLARNPYGGGEYTTSLPPTAPDDLYLAPGGGFGSHSEDEREARRVERALQQAAAVREARCVPHPNPLVGRIADLERRVAELESRGEQR